MGLLQAISGLNAAHNTIHIIDNMAHAFKMGFKEQNIILTNLIDKQNYQNKKKEMGIKNLRINNNRFFCVTISNYDILYINNDYLKLYKNQNIINENKIHLTSYSNLNSVNYCSYHQFFKKIFKQIDIPIKTTSVVKKYSILNNKNIIFDRKFDKKIANTYNHKLTTTIYNESSKQNFINLFFITIADKICKIYPYNTVANINIHPIKIKFNKYGTIISKKLKVNVLYNKKNKTENF